MKALAKQLINEKNNHRCTGLYANLKLRAASAALALDGSSLTPTQLEALLLHHTILPCTALPIEELLAACGYFHAFDCMLDSLTAPTDAVSLGKLYTCLTAESVYPHSQNNKYLSVPVRKRLNALCTQYMRLVSSPEALAWLDASLYEAQLFGSERYKMMSLILLREGLRTGATPIVVDAQEKDIYKAALAGYRTDRRALISIYSRLQHKNRAFFRYRR